MDRLVCIDDKKSVRAYCREEKKWYEMMKCVSWIDGRSSVQTYRDGLIVVGAWPGGNEGSQLSKHVSYLHELTGAVEVLPDLPHCLESARVVCDGEDVYVLGGYSDVGTLDTT